MYLEFFMAFPKVDFFLNCDKFPNRLQETPGNTFSKYIYAFISICEICF